MSPDLLLLSGRIALLVLLASLLAFIIGWLINGWRSAAALKKLQAQLAEKPEPAAPPASDDAVQAKALAEELRRNLSATESQCVIALEQRDEAERQAVQRASEVHQLTDEITALKGKIEGSEAARAALESQVAQLAEAKQAIESQSTDHAAAKAALEAKLAEQSEARAALESQVAQLAEAKQAIESQSTDHAAAQAALEAKLAEQTEARAALESQVAQLAEAKQALEALQRADAESKASLETLHGQLQSLQNAHAGTVAEMGQLRHQLASAEALAAIRQGQVDQLTQEKVEAEIALKARIAELEAHTAKPVALPVVAPQPVRLPKPPLPPVEVLAAPVDDSFMEFPRAPEETGRRPLGESLFDESAMVSFNPEVPSMDDARATLESLERELQEKEQVIGLLTAEQAQLWDELEAVRRSSPEEQHEKLHAAERAEHAATTKLAANAAERDRCRRQVRALTRSLALAAETDRADDLTRIKGIKGGISQQLHAFGICSYRQIVEWDEEDMAAFSELLAFKNRIYRDKWQAQAKALMEAKYGKKATA